MHCSLAFVVTLILLLLAASEEAHKHPEGAERTPVPAADTEDQSPKRHLHDDPPPPLRLNNSALGPPDVYLRVPKLGVRHIGLDVDNLQANVSLAASIAKMVDVHAGVAVGVEKVNISIDNVAARLDLVIRLGSLVDMVNRTMKSLDLNPKLVSVINTVGTVGSSAVQGLGSITGGALGKSQGGGDISIDPKGTIMEDSIGPDGKVERKMLGNWKEDMVPTGQMTPLPKGHVEKTFKYEKMNALVNILFNEKDEVVSTSVVKTGAEADEAVKAGVKPPGSEGGEL